MPLTAHEAWLLIEDAAENLKSCQLLSARKQKNVLHALKTLQETLAAVVDPYQDCFPNLQKRRKFYARPVAPSELLSLLSPLPRRS